MTATGRVAPCGGIQARASGAGFPLRGRRSAMDHARATLPALRTGRAVLGGHSADCCSSRAPGGYAAARIRLFLVEAGARGLSHPAHTALDRDAPVALSPSCVDTPAGGARRIGRRPSCPDPSAALPAPGTWSAGTALAAEARRPPPDLALTSRAWTTYGSGSSSPPDRLLPGVKHLACTSASRPPARPTYYAAWAAGADSAELHVAGAARARPGAGGAASVTGAADPVARWHRLHGSTTPIWYFQAAASPTICWRPVDALRVPPRPGRTFAPAAALRRAA